MTIDLAQLLDELEKWLEEQVPKDLSELPTKMLETVERVSNDLIASLNMHGPPSISIPFPPFNKETAPPPPPPPAPSLASSACTKAGSLARRHPLLFTAGAALAITAGVGTVGLLTGAGPFAGYAKELRRRHRFGTRGVVEDGMLKEAIVILAPSPVPPLLVPLAASLLKAGYIVIVAVPQVKEAEALERRLSGLTERNALRVLIYDTENSATFPPFHRSLLATLTLRFPAAGHSGQYTAGDPYNPHPGHIPRIHAFVSLYPLNPSPPSQPAALPALPALVSPGPTGHVPILVTLYPSSATLTNPGAFANQVLTSNHRLLGANLAAANNVRVVSVFLGQITLPTLPSIITEGRALSRREQAKQRLRESTASATATFTVLRDLVVGGLCSVYRNLAARVGFGAPARDYAQFESRLLRIIKSRCGHQYYIGQRAWLPSLLQAVPPRALPRVLSILPELPSETGPAPAPPPKSLSSAASSVPQSRSASSSDHEGGEDLASSIHTTGTNHSSADSSGLEGSWVGLDHAT
ncbi:hypothetical protein Q8F55_001313 [Vanrija albida]|uniref:DUF1776 family protein n=1 Tax=Vanrija albida TaxID=181172 RepID=A0ABR3QFN5_9TREE